jgi:hypothetical protein
MKTIITFVFTFLLCLPLGVLQAQSHADENDDKQSFDEDNFGDRLGKEIEQAVEHITRRWDDRWEKSQHTTTSDTLNEEQQQRLTLSEIEDAPGTHVYSTNMVIKDSEVVDNNVVVKHGDLTVYGMIHGNVLVVGGDLQVKSHGKITGDVRVIDGNIVKEDGAVIEGFEDKMSSAAKPYRETRKYISRSSRSFDVPWALEQTEFSSFIFRYNRVESVFLGLGSDKKYYWDGQRQWNAYGSLGWGFKSHTWRGNLGLSRQFAFSDDGAQSILEFGGEGYTLTDTKDPWKISRMENTIAALIFHEDYRDYFERYGYTLHAAYYTQHNDFKSELQIAYAADHYDSLTNKVDWAFFGGDKHFRDNPLIVPGKMRSVMFSGGLTTVSKTSKGPKGWTIFGSAEIAKKDWSGDFDFERYVVDVRRLQPLGTYDNINVRLRAGTSGGTLPQQKTFELGGLGTLNAYSFNELSGNRMLLINAEFVVNGNILDDLDFWPTWLFQHFNFILFTDAGFITDAATTASVTTGFDTMTWNDFKHDFGVAVGNRSGSFRIGVAWRTDHPEPAQFVLRIDRPF